MEVVALAWTEFGIGTTFAVCTYMRLDRSLFAFWPVAFSLLLSSPAFAVNAALEAAIAERYANSVEDIEEWFPQGKLPKPKIRAQMAVLFLTTHLDVSVVGILSHAGLISETSPPEDWKAIERLWIRILHRLDRETLLFVLAETKNLDTPEELKSVGPSIRLAAKTALGCGPLLTQ